MLTTPDADDARDVRDALRRGDPRILDPGPDQRFLVTRAGAVAVRETAGGGLALALERRDPRGGQPLPLVHLGMREGKRVCAVELEADSAERDAPGRDLWDLRRAAALLGAGEVELAVTAIAMGAWHRDVRCCSRCGHRLRAEQAGWVLRCPEDRSEHFPRTDPAVIMSLIDDEDRLLLARGARAPESFWSVLAGFVEPGETLAAAVARESYEETGLRVRDIRCIGSQPWPFPRSLMIGHTARVVGSAPPPRLLDGELAAARWFTRAQLRAEVEAARIRLPGPLSLGHRLIRRWYGATLPSLRPAAGPGRMAGL